jgi:oligoendopeptidase F
MKWEGITIGKVIKIKKRSEINKKYKWNLKPMYESDEAWEEDYNKVKELVKKVVKFKGNLTGAKKLLYTLDVSVELSKVIQKLFVYSHMKKDEDNSSTVYSGMHDRAQTIMTEAESAKSFIVPEILALPEEKIEKFMNKRKELKLYKIYIDEILRQKEHILSSREEEILAMTGDMAQASDNIYTMFNNADIKFPSIKNENGDIIEITHGNYGNLLQSEDRKIRQKAFKGMYSVYQKNQNTLTAIMNSNVKKDIFYSKIRKYNSSLEAALDDDNVSAEVYNKLIETVNNNLEPMYRYMRLKKKMLALPDLHMYDLYVPMVSEIKKEISYEKAKEIVKAGLSPLGQEYTDILQEGFNDAWIDVYENEGKTSGAYSWGTYDSKPYVLLNYQNNVDDVFTLAHEMGHSVHTYYSAKNQNYIYASYSIFVAEVASTTNENLLMKYMLKNASDKKEKMYYLNHYLEQFRTTLYRQTMFAEFEKWTHEAIENGQALTCEDLKKKYYDLNVKYYGPDVIVDNDIEMEWSRIPHFYNAFYVYQYSTGFSAAASLSKAILEEGETAVERYKDFLKSGSTDYPINLLKKAGVDMTDPKPVEDAIAVFNELLDELEKLVD